MDHAAYGMKQFAAHISAFVILTGACVSQVNADAFRHAKRIDVPKATAGTARNYPRNCAPRERVADRLEVKFKEQITGAGILSEAQGLLEVWVSAGGSWTAVVTDTEGMSCVVAAGDDWRRHLPQGELN